MRVAEKSVQRRIVLALAHLCSPEHQKIIFLDANGINHYANSFGQHFLSNHSLRLDCNHCGFPFFAGLELLLGLLESTSLKHQQDASLALYKLAQKATSRCALDAAPPSPTPQVLIELSIVSHVKNSDLLLE